MGNFFAVLATFWRISAKTNELLAFLLCCGLVQAVAGFTVFARIPAFNTVHTVLVVLLLLSFLLLLAFLLGGHDIASFKLLMVFWC
jgi:hypothetical protein